MKFQGYVTLAIGILFLLSLWLAIFSFFMIPLGIVMLIRSEKAGTLEQLGYTTLAIGILIIICFFEEVVNFFIFLLEFIP